MLDQMRLGKKSNGPSLAKVHQIFFFSFLISSPSQSAFVSKRDVFISTLFVYGSASAVYQKLRVIRLRSALMTNFPTVEFKVQRTATELQHQAFSCYATPLSQVSLHLPALLLQLCSPRMKVMQCFLDT